MLLLVPRGFPTWSLNSKHIQDQKGRSEHLLGLHTALCVTRPRPAVESHNEGNPKGEKPNYALGDSFMFLNEPFMSNHLTSVVPTLNIPSEMGVSYLTSLLPPDS